MSLRDEIHRLADELPDEKLEPAKRTLSLLLTPPTPPQLAELRRRSEEYRKRVEERFQQTRKPGTIGGLAGSGIGFGSSSSNSFCYWDDKALVYQTLRYFSGQQIEQMERIAISENGSQLLYELELSTGGRTLRIQEAFPREHEQPS
jgi:hypothetical protein